MRTIVSFFRCSMCREHDVDLSKMCRREGCPKEHDGYTEVRFIEPGSDGAMGWISPNDGATPPTVADEIDTPQR